MKKNKKITAFKMLKLLLDKTGWTWEKGGCNGKSGYYEEGKTFHYIQLSYLIPHKYSFLLNSNFIKDHQC